MIRVGVRVGLKVMFRSEICKLRARHFEIAQRIF